MKRYLEKELIKWKNQKEFSPLIIRGARQAGKSYLVENFGRGNFENTVTANFELQPGLKNCFETLEPAEIVNKLKLFLGVEIAEGKTLLFLDEIQECPPAISALRYFKEKMPRLAVAAAGSLLEFALQSSNFKMPVGRVSFLYLEPLSFSEFLEASGNGQLQDYLKDLKLNDKIEDSLHHKLLDLARTYMIIGGMPAVVKEYLQNKDFSSCQNIQSALLQTYRSDFGKYANIARHKYLLEVMDAVPRLVGQRVKYVKIDPGAKSRDLKTAIELLEMAGVINIICHSKASGLPLAAAINESKYKFNFLDVGLMQNVCGLTANLAAEKDLMLINAGAVAEQFAGQELRAYADKYSPARLFFWSRDKKGSMAEVDYLLNIGGSILPVEVKSGKEGRLKSLRMFLQEKKAPFGIRVSQEKLSYHEKILSVPLYMLNQLPRLVKDL